MMIIFKRICVVTPTQCCFSHQPDDNPLEAYDKDQSDIGQAHVNNIHLIMDSKTVGPTSKEFIKLVLTIIDSEEMQVGAEFQITPSGLVGSLRDSRDGITYAGSMEVDEEELYVNDIILPEKEGGVGKRHFMIRHVRETGGYQIEDLNDGTGTFIRLDSPYIVQNGNIISFGDSHMILTLENYINPSLSLKFIDGPKTNQSQQALCSTFTEKDLPVKIGRMADCHVRFDDASLSRYQCLIERNEQGWVFKDGDGSKLSTNGSWLFADFPVDMYGGIVFKAGQTLFKGELTPELGPKLS